MADDKATNGMGMTPTGLMEGNPTASLFIHVDGDTHISMDVHVDEDGITRMAKPDEVTAGNYRTSAIGLGSGITVFAHREDLVRLLVVLSEHLDVLDRADTADRKVAAR